MKISGISIIFFIVWSGAGEAFARAEDICDYYQKHLPKLYQLMCNGSRGGTRVGAGYSSFADGFNMNPAAVPTGPSAYGFETILSSPQTAQSFRPYPTFAVIKGFHKIGTAVSTASNQSFYGNDIVQRTEGKTAEPDLEHPEPALGKGFNLNLGTAVALNSAGSVGAAAPSLGVSLRYNKITHTVGWGTGLAVSSTHFSAGIGVTHEKVSNRIPALYFYSVVLGLKYSVFELEYTRLQHEGTFNLGPVQIGTLTAVVSRFILSAAIRQAEYLKLGDVSQTHYAVQFQLSSHLALGYLVNYIPGTQSVACQIYL